MKKILLITLLGTALAAQAQNTPAPAAPAAASVPAPSAAKKDLLNRLLALQQPALESTARNLAEQPMRQMLAAAEQALPRVPEDKREAAVKQIEGLAKKYAEEAAAVSKERSAKIAQSALLPLYNEKFSEDELRQLLVALEAPAYKKFQQAMPEAGNAFTQQLVTELRPVLDPKLKTLEASVASALGMTPNGEAPAKPAKPAASTPKPKK